MKFIKTDIEFKVDGKQIKFSVIHNLPEIQGLSIKDAIYSWTARTKKFTANSFINYINSKNTEHVAMTEKQYNIISKLGI